MKSPGMVFVSAGITFLLVGIATNQITIFLTIGIALSIVGIGIKKRGQKNQ
jgi:hypothetical protein